MKPCPEGGERICSIDSEEEQFQVIKFPAGKNASYCEEF